MATVSCDTSFLFSLYGRDTNSAKATSEVIRLRQALTLTVLNEFELLNAIRFAVFRKVMPRASADLIVDAFEADFVAGRLVIERVNLAEVVAEANRLSAAHTMRGGHRSFDLLHLAGAVRLGSEIFLSFDANQRALAKKAGIKVRP